MRTSQWSACRWPWSLGSSRHSPKVQPCQKAQSRTGRRGRRKGLNKSGCPSGRLGLTRTDEHRVSAFRVDGVQRCQSATRRVPRNWPRDFHPRSSLVFTARCLSSSATVSSAIWLICKNTKWDSLVTGARRWRGRNSSELWQGYLGNNNGDISSCSLSPSQALY